MGFKIFRDYQTEMAGNYAFLFSAKPFKKSFAQIVICKLLSCCNGFNPSAYLHLGSSFAAATVPV